MVDFEKIGDTFEDGFDKVKDFTKKNKVFTVAIIGVGAFALYKFFTNKTTSEDTEYVSTYAYVPTGYDGYPTMSESVSYDDVVDQLRNETTDINSEFYDEIMSDVSKQIEDVTKIIEDNQNITKPIIIGSTGYGSNLSTGSYIEEQRIIEQMKSNSEAWHDASDEEKERLHQENVALGSLLGGSFDSASGTWSKDGESLYTVSTTTNKTTPSNSTNVPTTSGSKSTSSNKSTSSGSTATVTSVTKNNDGTYTHKWSNGKTTVQTQKNGGLVLSTK